MHVVFASDETYFPGLACGLMSILRAATTGGGITFHILDGGIEEESWSLLEREIPAHGEEIRLQRHRLSLAEFAGLRQNAGAGVMTYARLLMPSLIDEDEAIYVDSDVLCFRDLSELWAEPLGENMVAACQDFNVKFIANDPLFGVNGHDDGSWYFNAGFMKVNLKLWREEDVQRQLLRLVRDHQDKCTWRDQTALNHCFKGRVKYLDRGWNRFSFEVFSISDYSEGRINIHYVSMRKPWMNHASDNVSDVVWRLFRTQYINFAGRPRGRLKSAYESGYDLMLRAVCRWGGVGIAFLDGFCWLLRVLFGGRGLRGISDWLNRQGAKIELLQYVGSWLRQPAGRLPDDRRMNMEPMSGAGKPRL